YHLFLAFSCRLLFSSFSFTPPSPPQIYTLSLHDALPISHLRRHQPENDGLVLWHEAQRAEIARALVVVLQEVAVHMEYDDERAGDRKSTRLNSSHVSISYAVFCLKKKKKKKKQDIRQS